jgi:hypothetical protein
LNTEYLILEVPIQSVHIYGYMSRFHEIVMI